MEFKYEGRWLATNRKSFTFDDQTRDNMFWTLVSGGGIAAFYESVMFGLYADKAIGVFALEWGGDDKGKLKELRKDFKKLLKKAKF